MNGHVNVPLPRLSETLPLRVPDAAGWTIDDVASYFRGVGFPDQAEIFRDQVRVYVCGCVCVWVRVCACVCAAVFVCARM